MSCLLTDSLKMHNASKLIAFYEIYDRGQLSMISKNGFFRYLSTDKQFFMSKGLMLSITWRTETKPKYLFSMKAS